MSNIERKCSYWHYEMPHDQLAALLDIARKKNRDIDELICSALDEYIQREEQTWKK